MENAASFSALIFVTLAAMPAAAQPVLPDAALQHCAALDDPAARLACYDKLAGRIIPPGPAVSNGRPDAPAALPAPAPAPDGATGEAGPGLTPVLGSFLSQYWELERAGKRGTFNFIGYRPNFILPLHATTRINRSPQSPTREAVQRPGFKNVETKLQISIRTKLIEDILLPEADLWFGFTQQSLWQVFDGQGSSPFRSTDYEPELIYVAPIAAGMQALPLGWRWRFVQLGLAHQSNGQDKPLSRSWNRVYLGTGVERGEYSIVARIAKRIPESDDDNPDLTTFRGRGDLLMQWTPGRATASLLYRNNLRGFRRGALQFDWTYPVAGNRHGGLRWYLQVFSGYGETLTDYNFRQTSIGAGVTLFEF